MKRKILLVFGTRPEAIKMCPLVNELKTRKGLQTVVCVTAQHRQMLDQVLTTFGVVPDYDLNIMKDRQTLFDITTGILNQIREVLEEVRPDVVLVHGDTSTTFVTALACFYLQIPVGHVEAGLRTYNIHSPYPEEFNRQAVGILSRYNFAPTRLAAEHLEKEGKDPATIYVTGNTVIDAMRYTVNDRPFSNEALNRIDFSRRVVALTCHRRENYGEPMEQIMTAIRDTARNHPDAEVVYPVHLSPTVQECARRILGGEPGVHLIEPLNVEEMHNLMARSYLVMTDSGGLQEEAPALGKPVLVLRRETERPEAVEAGTVKLSGVAYDAICADAHRLLTDEAAYQAMAKAVNPYGDGQACPRIAQAIAWYFDHSLPRPADFRA